MIREETGRERAGMKLASDPSKIALVLVPEENFPASLDTEVRRLLCETFPEEVTTFSATRAWNGCRPKYSVMLTKEERVIAHLGIVERAISVGGVAMRAAGVQNVCVHPSYRGRHLSAFLLEEAMSEAESRGFEVGLLFCIPELDPIYARSGWRRLSQREIACRDATGASSLLPAKNIAMDYPICFDELPAGVVDLNGRDW